MIRIKRGLDLPISGSPVQAIEPGRSARSVGLLGQDYPGMKPTMEVAVGDRVKAGQLLFTDKKTPGVRYTAPASGIVSAINRGAKRVFESLVIDVEGDDAGRFESYGTDEIGALDRHLVVQALLDSGHWTAIRTRPYSKIPAIDSTPHSIFITAMDSRPLAADPQLFINEQKDAFLSGIDALSRLTDGTVHVCSADKAEIPQSNNPKVRQQQFKGPHPAGLVGTHIHFLDPVNSAKTVWTLGYQDVIAIGHLFLSGELFFERVVSIAGPDVETPRLLRTRMGASTDELTAGEIAVPGEHRVISGSVLDGRTAAGSTAYLGRFHNQVSILKEGTARELLGYLMPGRRGRCRRPRSEAGRLRRSGSRPRAWAWSGSRPRGKHCPERTAGRSDTSPSCASHPLRDRPGSSFGVCGSAAPFLHARSMPPQQGTRRTRSSPLCPARGGCLAALGHPGLPRCGREPHVRKRSGVSLMETGCFALLRAHSCHGSGCYEPARVRPRKRRRKSLFSKWRVTANASRASRSMGEPSA